MPTRRWSPARRRTAIRRLPAIIDPLSRARQAAAWPLSDCFLSRDWRSTGRPLVVWVRQCPATRQHAVATVRADLGGEGFVDAAVDLGARLAALWTHIESLRGPQQLTRCDPRLAVALLATSEVRAGRAGAPRHGQSPLVWTLIGEVDLEGYEVAIPTPPAAPAYDVAAARSTLQDRIERGMGLFRGWQPPEA